MRGEFFFFSGVVSLTAYAIQGFKETETLLLACFVEKNSVVPWMSRCGGLRLYGMRSVAWIRKI